MASVLVCDDEPVVVELLCSLLEAHGYLVPVAHTGAEAVALAHLHQPDLLLLDMDLPDMSGTEVLRRIRALSTGRQTAAIFLTGIEDPTRMAEAMQQGGVSYIFKRAMKSTDLITTISQQIALPAPSENLQLPLAASSEDDSELGDTTRRMPDPDRVLTWIDGWFLRLKIARGGMGDVYVAERGDQRSAIKVLPRGCDQQSEMGRRFLREIAILRSLDHPHIVRYLDSGISADRPFLVMELIQARNLRQHIRKYGGIDANTARVLLDQMAAALICARDHGIIHRDLKPSNILVATHADDGAASTLHAILCDFGIAAIRDTLFGSDGRDKLTRHGVLIGTPAYLSPEQAGGSTKPDQVQDIYGLGATLYAAITGQPPFHGEIEDVLARKQVEDPDLRPLEEAIDDPALVALISAMLRRDPAQRIENWEAVIAAIA